MRRREIEPETRVGICCGDACQEKHSARGTWNYAQLFKVPGWSGHRYRCSHCFRRETGYRHHLDDVAKCVRTYCTGAPCLAPENCGMFER